MRYLLILPLLLFGGCVGVYQLVQLESKDIFLSGKVYHYENDTVTLNYNFWSEGGTPVFSFYNKLDIPIYIDWKKSSLIIKGEKHDYFIDASTISSSTYSQGVGVNTKYVSAIESHSLINGTMVKEERITFIPPHSSVIMNKSRLRIIPTSHFVLRDPYKNADGLKEARYSYDQSVYKIRNFVAYSTKEDMSDIKYVDNEFYISSITEIPQMKFEAEKYNSFEPTYPFATPTAFYLFYRKN